MKLENAGKPQRGVVLIVVVGVLAILSLLAATFGMIARVELAASRNQTEYEMAREAAHAASEALINSLQTSLNGSSMTSGPMPAFFPNSADTDGQFLYKRDGVKVYLAVNSTVPSGSVTPDWLQGLGLQDAGMFNINAMGYANDLGSNANMDIRYTSFDCSLVRLLATRIATISTLPINANDMSTITSNYDINFANPTEQQRVAILLSRAIINWRHGPDGLPGAAGTEERRLGHLPRWNSKIGCTNVNAGTNYPGKTNDKYDWGYDDSIPNVPIGIYPSLYINATDVLGSTAPAWSYAEPCVWTSFQGINSATALPLWPGNASSTFAWGNDTGLPLPGLFWGTVATYTGGAGTATLTVNTNNGGQPNPNQPLQPSQPGWRPWPTTTPYIWANCYVYFASGPARWWCAQINDTGAGTYLPNTLTLSSFSPFPQIVPPNSAPPSALPTNPNPGDAFCIFCVPPSVTLTTPPSSPLYVGLLNARWDNTTPYCGDLVPNAMFWPSSTAVDTLGRLCGRDATLATEGNILDLLVDNNCLLSTTYPAYSTAYGQVANMGAFTTAITSATDPSVYDATKNWAPGACANYVVHIYAGTGRGQVRTIKGNSATQLTLSTGWTVGNFPDLTSQYRIEYNDDNLPSKFQPNNLQGDDRLYLTLGDLRDSVIVPALVTDGLSPSSGTLTTAGAQAVANILLPYFLPYLSVSTQAIQASQSLCSINDWAADGVDNDSNGVVDDNAGTGTQTTPTEPQYEVSSPQNTATTSTNRALLAKNLYNKLGLYTWAHAPANANLIATRVQQAAQLVANIIDFREPMAPILLAGGTLLDPTDVPTVLTKTNLGETSAAIPNFTVYGAKGLHVTQVMPSPDAIYSANCTNLAAPNEMTSDGNDAIPSSPDPLHDTVAWDWRNATDPNNSTYVPPAVPPFPLNPAWELMRLNADGTNPTATFTFTGLQPGYYALRLIGAPQNAVFNVYYTPLTWTPVPAIPPGTPYGYARVTTPDPDTTYPGWYTGFVRNGKNGLTSGATDGSGALACFQVLPLGATQGTPQTLTFQLQMQPPVVPGTQFFRGFALCAQYIQLTNIATHDINLTGWQVATDQTTPVPPTGPSGQTPKAIMIPANYTRAADSQVISTNRIPGAAVGPNGVLSTSTSGIPTPSTVTFPINYGTYVICMCEEAYERQWGPKSGDIDYISNSPGVSNNQDGKWGDERNEVCTLYPYGDCPSSAGALCTIATTQNNATMALLLGIKKTGAAPPDYTPAVSVYDSAQDLIAGCAGAGSGTTPTSGVDGIIPTITFPGDTAHADCYTSIEKTLILQPTWNTATTPNTGASYWLPYQPYTTPPTQLCAAQNALVAVPVDEPRIHATTSNPTIESYIRSYLNRNYTELWNGGSTGYLPTPTLLPPSSLVTQNRVFPIILNRPYPTTGWLGLVPTSNTDAINAITAALNVPAAPVAFGSWRTIDPNPTPSAVINGVLQSNPPTTPEQLLGTLMSNATVGGVYARFNINTAPEEVLNSVLFSTPVPSVSTLTNGVYVPNELPTTGTTATANINTNTLQDTSQTWTPSALINMVVFIDAGTGQGQVRRITGNTVNTLTLNCNWVTSLDSTSKYRIMNSQAGLIISARQQRAGNPVNQNPYSSPNVPNISNFPLALANSSWANWDELLDDPIFQNSPNAGVTGIPPSGGGLSGIGFFDNPRPTDSSSVANADAGAGTYADGFPANSNEKKEWFMRFANLFCLNSTSFQFTVAGLVYKDQPWDSVTMQNNEPIAMVRIEVDVDLSTGTPSIVHFRYLTQE